VDLERGTVVTSFVGPSVETHNNDGMNCMNSEAPPEWNPPCRPGSEEVTLADSRLVANNLGGKGPSNGPQEIRLRGVAPTHSGSEVDLVITTRGQRQYKP